MRYQTSDGLSLAYLDEGAGLPVLCLPGLTRNASDFDDLKTALGRNVRLIRPTYRGRGSSDWAPDFLSYNVAQEAKDVLELLDFLGLDQALFVGTSRGGLISIVLAAFAKDRMAGVILNDIGPDLSAGGLAKIMDYIGIRPQAATYGDAARAMQMSLGAQFPDVDHSRWKTCAERWYEEGPQGLSLRYDPRLRDAMLAQAEIKTPDLWPLFDALAGVPLGLIRGANTDLLSMETVAKMKSRRPDMLFANVPNRGHVPFLDEAESLALIETLIDKVMN